MGYAYCSLFENLYISHHMFSILKKALFGNSNDRNIKSMLPLVDQINGFEDQIASLDDTALRSQTDKFREKLSSGATLDCFCLKHLPLFVKQQTEHWSASF